MNAFLRGTVFAGLSLVGAIAMAETVEMKIGASTYEVTLLENDTAKSLVSQLPLSLKFEDFGPGTERIAYLPKKLALGSAPRSTSPVRGDLTYYSPWGNLAAFRTRFRESEGLIPLGHMNEQAIQALEKSGGQAVELKLKR